MIEGQRLIEAGVTLLVGGGIGAALIQRIWPSRDVAVKAQGEFEQRLMLRIDSQEKRITCLEAELSKWQRDYLQLAGEYGELQLRHERVELELAEVKTICTRAGLMD